MLLFACALPVLAQALLIHDAFGQEAVIPETNTRTAYAQVLHVEPVYQTLRATRMEQQCDGKTVPPNDPPRGLARIVDAVKGAFTPNDADKNAPTDQVDASEDCRLVSVEREFKRPIAYDVDYVFKGMKYRSRLPYDPGNRLRVELSLTPYIPPPDDKR